MIFQSSVAMNYLCTGNSVFKKICMIRDDNFQVVLILHLFEYFYDFPEGSSLKNANFNKRRA